MAEMDQLVAKLDELSEKLSLIHVDLRVLQTQHATSDSMVRDHEKRIRSLEESRIWVAGAAATAGAALSVAWQYVSKKLGG